MNTSVALSLDPGCLSYLVNNFCVCVVKIGKVSNFILIKLRLSFFSTPTSPPLVSDGFELAPGIYETHLRGNGIGVLNLHLMGYVCVIFSHF